ncbi:gluconolactonase [Zobellia uliginosa]|uniref:Gluconolactonase n=1 Tax=Zobellia uliginosa TaxID=143224 RepID=A0ABY1L026_9FLAO|nr:SMP-30/gluconolactonase/LRE family protein [Zobellia uliginosa]SIS99424.1 gluconolactonase [Zobellia uliginosa]
MKIILAFVLVMGLHTTLVSQEREDRFSVEILDSEALQVIDANAKIEVIGSGFAWTEGPLWIADGDYLLFSDIPNNTVFKIDALGNTSEYLKPSGYLGKSDYGAEPGSNGLLLNPKGELVLMQHGERRVAKMKSGLNAPKANYEAIADSFEGKRFNSPNDGVFDADGNLYFTDPPYGLPQQMDDPQKELDFQGVYCLKTSGEIVLVDKLSRPNGIAVSPDASKLYVAVSNPEHAVWYQYDILSTGRVENKRIFYDLTPLVGQEGQQGLPDGMKMHSKGYLFATGPGGVWIFNGSGKPLAKIHTGEKTANCAFGKDEKILYLTADDYIFRVLLK